MLLPPALREEKVPSIWGDEVQVGQCEKTNDRDEASEMTTFLPNARRESYAGELPTQDLHCYSMPVRRSRHLRKVRRMRQSVQPGLESL